MVTNGPPERRLTAPTLYRIYKDTSMHTNEKKTTPPTVQNR